jgi:hypothetical protein
MRAGAAARVTLKIIAAEPKDDTEMNNQLIKERCRLTSMSLKILTRLGGFSTRIIALSSNKQASE